MSAPAGPAFSAIPLTPAEAGPLVRRASRTIRRALNDGSLHGHRPHDIPGAHWVVTEAALRAWITGADEAAQQRACGLCANPAPAVPSMRGRGRS